ncbi:hypothetical protein FO519_007657 [Halicephalobus sp. NKZ332]|nr:hypothetical protein FO519_007657 [Halicephalobus sp. NKZ332]
MTLNLVEPPVKKSREMKRFLFVFSQNHPDFRIPELLSVCDLFGIEIDKKWIENDKTHLYVMEFDSEDPVKKILSRTALLRNVFEIIFDSEDLDSLEKKMKENPQIFDSFNEEHLSWRFKFRRQGKKTTDEEFVEMRERFTEVMTNVKAPVDLKNPKIEFSLIEDLSTLPETDRRVYFGITLGEGQLNLKTMYNLKDRKYIGNSTMDPELAFIQSNLVQARPNTVLLDPFCGTGGLLIPAAHFGSTVVGTEINYLVARGEGKSARKGEGFLTKDQTVFGNFEQYNLKEKYCDVIIGDASRHGVWRENLRFEAISADPPYGIREKGRKVGNKERKEHWTLPGSVHEQHFPEKTKYDLNQVYLDLMDLAASKLAINGRLAFWFPVIRDTYSEDVLPRHEALELISNCEQVLTSKGSRRLLTFKKLREPKEDEKSYVIEDSYEKTTFRQKLQGKMANARPVTLFDGLGIGRYMMKAGAPGPHVLKKVAVMMKEATEKVMSETIESDGSLLQYGTPNGPPEFLDALASFLSAEYREPVNRENLVLSAGATSGLVYLLTQIFPQKTTVYTEKLTYFLAVGMLKSLEFPICGVNIESDGIDLKELETRWSEAFSVEDVKKAKEENRFLAVLYLVPHYQNPTGTELSPEKCQKLVKLARKYSILIFCDDVYNILHYNDKVNRRLFAYDNVRDPDYGIGHVISNGTFSKLLSPGLRLGWIELPLELKRKYWSQSWILISGGSINTYTASIVTELLKNGEVSKLVKEIRLENKTKMETVLEILREELPKEFKIWHIPSGGYFVYILLPENLNSEEVVKFFKEKHDLLVNGGENFWAGLSDDEDKGRLANGIRLAIAYPLLDELIEGSRIFCRGLKEMVGK